MEENIVELPIFQKLTNFRPRVPKPREIQNSGSWRHLVLLEGNPAPFPTISRHYCELQSLEKGLEGKYTRISMNLRANRFGTPGETSNLFDAPFNPLKSTIS